MSYAFSWLRAAFTSITIWHVLGPLAALILILGPATATSQSRATRPAERTELSLQDLTNSADVVAVGKVSSIRSRWTSDKSRIVTEAIVTVGEVLKGDASQTTITITYPGGEVGAEGELYSHTARFARNEDVVVFAAKDKQGALRVVGGAQGKFSVATDKSTGKKVISDGSSVEQLKSKVSGFIRNQTKQ